MWVFLYIRNIDSLVVWIVILNKKRIFEIEIKYI